MPPASRTSTRPRKQRGARRAHDRAPSMSAPNQAERQLLGRGTRSSCAPEGTTRVGAPRHRRSGHARADRAAAAYFGSSRAWRRRRGVNRAGEKVSPSAQFRTSRPVRCSTSHARSDPRRRLGADLLGCNFPARPATARDRAAAPRRRGLARLGAVRPVRCGLPGLRNAPHEEGGSPHRRSTCGSWARPTVFALRS